MRSIVAFLLCSGLAFAQAEQPRRPSVATPKGWKAPRTPDGVPDLQGLWTNVTVTPLQRPANLANKPFFTEAEAQAFEKETVARNNADVRSTGAADVGTAYNDFWYNRGDQVVPTLRTSLIVDPPDGRVPALTDYGKKLQAERAELRRQRGPADGPESRSLAERCIVWPTGGPPMVPSFYNNNYQIVQGPTSVAIIAEVIDIRIIPLDGRPHAPSNVRGYLGDSRGRWEGDTLVVETTNFNNRNNFRGSGEGLRLIERFTRTSPNSLSYEFTVEDPGTFTAPWTAANTMSTLDGVLYEYACHEANISMFASLQGARAAEKQNATGTAPAGSPR